MQIRKRIIKLRKEQPLLTGSDISRKMRVSRQYVSRILQETGLNNKQPNYKRVVVSCKVCGKRTPRGQKICPEGDCRDTYYNIAVKCSFCQYEFTMKRSQIVQRYKRGWKHIYCSHTCYAKGKTDGIS